MVLTPYYQALREETGCEPPADLLAFVNETPSDRLAAFGFLQREEDVEETLWYCNQDAERPWLEAGFLPFLNKDYLLCLIGMKAPFAGLVVIDPTYRGGARGVHFSSFSSFLRCSKLDRAEHWHDWAEALIHEHVAVGPNFAERVEIIRDEKALQIVDSYIAGLLPRLHLGREDPVSDEYVAFLAPACSQAMAEKLLELGEKPFDQFFVREAAAKRLRRLGEPSALAALEVFVSLRRDLPHGYVDQHIKAGEHAIASIKEGIS